MSVEDSLAAGRLATLRASAEALARQIDVGGGTVAQCVAQLRATLAEIAELTPAEQGAVTGLSDFERKLRERESAAKGSRRTGS